MQKFGIDVSRYQSDFDFIKAKKEGVEFVIVKSGGADDGLYKDSKYEQNYKAAKAAGLPVGSYYYLSAQNVTEAKEQALHYISLSKDKQFEYPLMADVEGSMADLPGSRLEPIIRTFCETVESAGYWVGMYFGLAIFYWHLKDAKSLVARFSWWLPYWGKTKPNHDNIQMWQFGGSTNFIRSNTIAGVVCDQDYCYYDYPTNIKARGKNGFKAAATSTPSSSSTAKPSGGTSSGTQSNTAAQQKPAKKTVDQFADEVWAGKYGNDPERSAKIKAEGGDPDAVQRRVEEKYYGKKTTTSSPAASSAAVGSNDGSYKGFKVGDAVRITSDAKVYGTSLPFQKWVYSALLYVREINPDNGRITISTIKDPKGPVTGAADVKYLKKA